MWNRIILWSVVFLAVVGITVGGLYWLRTREVNPIVPLQQGISGSQVQSAQAGSAPVLTAQQQAHKAELERIRKSVPKDIFSTWDPEELKKRNESIDAYRAQLDATSTQP